MDVGLNIGSSYAKAVGSTSGSIKVIGMPSVTGTYDVTGFGLHSQDILALEDDGVLVGTSAVEQSAYTFRYESRNWITSDEWRQVFYGVMSEMTSAAHVDVNIVTGLPVGFYENDRTAMANLLKKAHTFKRLGRSRQNVLVKNVRVVPEPFGTVFYMAFNDHGVMVSDILAMKKGVIDVGSKTVNYQSVPPNTLRSIDHESAMFDYGCWDIARLLKRQLTKEYPDIDLKDHQVLDAVFKGSIRYNGKEIDLSDSIERYAQQLQKVVAAAISTAWQENKGSFDIILLTGGGSRLVKETVMNLFPQAVVVDDPIYSNAIGMHRFARYLTQNNGWN